MFKKNDISKTINFIEDIILPTAVHITITIMSQRITHTLRVKPLQKEHITPTKAQTFNV